MLTPEQHAHFNTFGFLRLPQLFNRRQMAACTRAAEALWASEPEAEIDQERRLDRFVEGSPPLTRLLLDGRFYPVIGKLLGPDFIWVGSEGNISNKSHIGWHSDRKYYRRGEEHWIDYRQVKAMLYLDEVGRDTGCLRVIPGSHKMPFHQDLAQQELDPAAAPFAQAPPDLPCTALESSPGDVILFNHCIWHAAFGGGKNRRYIGLKFAARPTTGDQLITLERYTPKIFQPHEAFCTHPDPRIRALVEPLAGYARGELAG